jgi:hypothetical protein
MKRAPGLLCLILLAAPLRSWAAPESSLTLHVEPVSIQAEWQVRLESLATALQLDADRDGEVTWQEIEHRRADIESYLAAHLAIAANGTAVSFSFDKLIFGVREGEPFLLAQIHADAAEEVSAINVRYTLGEACRLGVVWVGRGMQQSAIPAAGGSLTFQRSTAASSGFLQALRRGIWHIWTGYDHILFLLVLLIPAVFRSTFREAVLSVVIIVSAFTAAHSITLACASLGWIQLPGRLVESVIAASIVIAAANNFLFRTPGLSRSPGGRSAWLAFGFGLIHGFGFAGALSEIGAEGLPWWQTLLAFNLGVEAGQLAIVAAFLPLAFLLRETRFYRTGVLYGGSCAAGLCALFWFWERAVRGSI